MTCETAVPRRRHAVLLVLVCGGLCGMLVFSYSRSVRCVVGTLRSHSSSHRFCRQCPASRLRPGRQASSLDSSGLPSTTVSSSLPETVIPSSRDGQAGVYVADGGSQPAADLLVACRGLRDWSSWYRAPGWLHQGDAMTLFSAFGRRPETIGYERHLVETADGGRVSLDVVTRVGRDEVSLQRTTPMAVLVSGLGGSSKGAYVRSMSATLLRRGFAVAVLNMRGCGSTELVTPRLFSAYRGSTDDVRSGVSYVRRKLLGGSPTTPVMLIGWSNGGTIVANTLAEQDTGTGKSHDGAWTTIQGAAALSTPHDMERSTHICETRWFSRLAYNRYVAKSLVKQIRPYADYYRSGPVAAWSNEKATVAVDIDMLLGAETIREIDEAITRRVFGYQSVVDYYQDASSFRRLCNVTKPLLLVSASDDPVSSSWVPIQEVRQNPKLVLVYTDHGGHLGWLDEVQPQQSRWLEELVADFLAAVVA
eukprot:TRINITY_DN27532_c0_g1_i1.p1 TRINITY_DN27532_c0_g1~~TRINITY_DN27532_c0_g1_i1.p1  ORF type:complete len:477 (+),score=57.76 TRINITY_DN27532_c0_g1_i1:144-1574(+)